MKCPNCMDETTWYKGACMKCWWKPGDDFFLPHFLKPEFWHKEKAWREKAMMAFSS